ncbi:MAG: hypothetical protein NC548_42920 [Lachnospiraceae bacterium]|nr:hypothetical protein [Lachnospiraceae bacterium]
MSLDDSYIMGIDNPTSDDVAGVWVTYGMVIDNDPVVYQMVLTDLLTLTTPDYCTKFSDGNVDLQAAVAKVLGLFNQTWSEGNEVIHEEGGIKEVFRQRKKVMIEGVNITSMILDRLIEDNRNKIALQTMLFDRLSYANSEPLYHLADDKRIVTMFQPYHIYDIETTVREFAKLRNTQAIRVLIQANMKGEMVTGYYARAVNYDDMDTFRLVIEDSLDLYPNIRRLSNDGMAVGALDLYELVDYCKYIYDRWTVSQNSLDDESSSSAECAVNTDECHVLHEANRTDNQNSSRRTVVNAINQVILKLKGDVNKCSEA